MSGRSRTGFRLAAHGRRHPARRVPDARHRRRDRRGAPGARRGRRQPVARTDARDARPGPVPRGSRGRGARRSRGRSRACREPLHGLPRRRSALAYLSLIALDDGDRSAAERIARERARPPRGTAPRNGRRRREPAHSRSAPRWRQGPIYMPASSISAGRSSSRAPAGPSYWHAHALIRLASALHRARATARPRAPRSPQRDGDLEVLPDEGVLGDPRNRGDGRHSQDVLAARDSSGSSSAKRSSESSACSRPAPR